MTYAKLALKFGPYVAIALLIGVVLWMRGNNIAAHADKEEAETRVTTLEEANASLQATIDLAKQIRADNDKIAAGVAVRLEGNQVREVHTRETITEVVRNDPEAAAWADTPVPLGVRDGLRAGQVDAPPR